MGFNQLKCSKKSENTKQPSLRLVSHPILIDLIDGELACGYFSSFVLPYSYFNTLDGLAEAAFNLNLTNFPPFKDFIVTKKTQFYVI
ncbi:MAG: hypothetical protein O2951_08350 [Bacteroidetes bacterium]|nr:hypothetical protein [Bacteroidota bacterium]